MGAFRIIYALTTMFSLGYCYEYSLAFDMPTILNSITSFATQALSSSQDLLSARASPDPNADADSDVAGPTLVERVQKVTLEMVSYMATMLNSLSRRTTKEMTTKEMKPNVEMGTGAIKSEQIVYPPNYFVNRLKTLLKLKKKEEDNKKPLNKPEK